MVAAINDESISYTLKSLHSNLEKHKEIEKKLMLLQALHELEINESDNLNYLTPKYRKLLSEEEELKKNSNTKPSYLERLYGKYN